MCLDAIAALESMDEDAEQITPTSSHASSRRTVNQVRCCSSPHVNLGMSAVCGWLDGRVRVACLFTTVRRAACLFILLAKRSGSGHISLYFSFLALFSLWRAWPSLLCMPLHDSGSTLLVKSTHFISLVLIPFTRTLMLRTADRRWAAARA